MSIINLILSILISFLLSILAMVIIQGPVGATFAFFAFVFAYAGLILTICYLIKLIGKYFLK
jgi:hypothetical protein